MCLQADGDPTRLSNEQAELYDIGFPAEISSNMHDRVHINCSVGFAAAWDEFRD